MATKNRKKNQITNKIYFIEDIPARDSAEYTAWLDSLPPYMRDLLTAEIKAGTIDEVPQSA